MANYNGETVLLTSVCVAFHAAEVRAVTVGTLNRARSINRLARGECGIVCDFDFVTCLQFHHTGCKVRAVAPERR